MNIEELVAYGKQKHVGIILWTVWKTLDDQFEASLEQFEKWGVKGIKVDFMQRDDQKVMNFYTRVCREAAKHKLLVDFHGDIRPATMTRTWPNLINTEGVKGLEDNKWSEDVTPEHDVTLASTRMFLGPMDYTPGAMRNATKNTFAKIFNQPMSQGRVATSSRCMWFMNRRCRCSLTLRRIICANPNDAVPGPGAHGVGRNEVDRR